MTSLTYEQFSHVRPERRSMTQVFQAALGRLMAEREYEARLRLADYLKQMDAETLKRIGYSSEEIERIARTPTYGRVVY